jgi:hypothetical protein
VSGAPIRSYQINEIMYQLKRRIIRLIEISEMKKDEKEKKKLFLKKQRILESMTFIWR